MRWVSRGGVRVLEAELPRARAAFTTRIGGVSAAPYESLNLGLGVGDEPGAVRENRRRLAAALGRNPDGLLIGRQVHGAEICGRAEAPTPNPYLDLAAASPADADGQLTASPHLTPIVLLADCLPVAVAGGGGVAMLHCGWRGLAAGIVARGCEALEPSAAAIGPGVGPCCYEVGDEVLAPFAELGQAVAPNGRLDLVEVARRLLERAGVYEVETADICTSCDAELFFSHRRDRVTGRHAGLVWRERNEGG